MDHVITLDLADVPTLRDRFPEAAALSVFLPDAEDHDGDMSKARVVAVPEEGLVEPDGTSQRFAVVPLDLPEDAFSIDETRSALARLGGHAGGEPLWLQGDEAPTVRGKRAPLVLQLNASLAGAHVNLGGEGSLYVFGSNVVFQCL